MKAWIRQFDTQVAAVIGLLSERWHPLFIAITTMGDPVVTVSIGAAVVLWGIIATNVRLMLAGSCVWITLFVGYLLKLLFNRERPMTEYAANLRIDTYSFPSGHSSGSMIAYGLLAYLAWHLLPQPWNYIVVGMLALLIIAIGISRIYLGAHFPSDVLAGWLLGGIVLTLVILVVRPLI